MVNAHSFVAVLILGIHPTTPGEFAPVADRGEVTILVPAYFYPSGEGLKEWKKLIDSGKEFPITAIVNPDSGPGKRLDENYLALFGLVQKSKVTLIGYVTLSYGKRPISAVKADIDSWIYFYPDVRGIFFDEQPSGIEQAAFANECVSYARQRISSAQVISNPGVVCAREYLTGADGPTVCMFENDKGFDAYQLPDWAAQLSPGRFAVLLYQVGNTQQMRKSLQDIISKRAAHVYITDAKGPMPWSRLPSYWAEFVQAVAEENERNSRKR
jgi:hypothetical protein